jgi:hypothetical protein
MAQRIEPSGDNRAESLVEPLALVITPLISAILSAFSLTRVSS